MNALNLIRKTLGISVSIGGGVLTLLGKFAPSSNENPKIDYFLFAVHTFWPELLVICCIGLLLLIPEILWLRLKEFISGTAEQLPTSTPWRTSKYIILLLSWSGLYLLAAPAWREFHGMLRARTIFLKEFYNISYRESIVAKELTFEKYSAYERAAGLCRLAIVSFPGVEWKDRNSAFEAKLRYLNGMLKYSEDCLSDAKRMTGAKLNREAFGRIVKCVEVNPENVEGRIELSVQLLTLQKAEQIPNRFYLACRDGDSKMVSQLLRDWGWYIMEDIELSESKAFRGSETASEFSKMTSEVDFRKQVENSWELDYARSLKRVVDFIAARNSSAEFISDIESGNRFRMLSKSEENDHFLEKRDAKKLGLKLPW